MDLEYLNFIIAMLALIILVLCGLAYADAKQEQDDSLDHEIEVLDEQITLLRRRAKHINLRI